MKESQTTQAAVRPALPGLRRLLPILEWLPRYNRAWLAADVLAGLTLWGLVVPEGMAYAGIAGLPPQAGLYTLLVSLLLYACLGTARHLTVSGTSASAALLASSVVAVLASTAIVTGNASSADPATYQSYASAFVLIVGVVFLIAAAARLGFITQFLSKPVMDGFVTGLAVFVAVGQLNKLFGVERGEGNTLEKLVAVARQLPEANWISFAVGALAIVLLFLLPRWKQGIPAGLIVLFGAIALSAAGGLAEKYGVEVVGLVPQGLPAPALPRLPLEAVLAMVLPAMGVLLMTYSEALGVASEFAEKHGYEVDSNQELNAYALTNIVSSAFGGVIAAGSVSASAVKEAAGARTQVANLISWGMVVITLLFLTPIFASLPEAVLAALIIHAVWHIIASRKLEKIRLASRTEFWLALLAFLGVILIDVLEGMVIGIVAAMVLVIARSSRPHLASLGRVPGVPGAYSDLSRHPENDPIPGLLIVRLDTPMYYANAPTVRDRVRAWTEQASPPVRAVLFDAAAQADLDVTSAEVLKRLIKDLHGRGIDLYLADVHAPVRDTAIHLGLLELLGEDQIFPTVDMAVRHFESTSR